MDITTIAQLARGLAAQFGPNCEVVYHDLTQSSIDQSIQVIENGHVTGRKLGDGPSKVVIDTLKHRQSAIKDHLGYRTTTKDGKTLKSSTIFLRDDNDEIIGILGINFDITHILQADRALQSLLLSESDDAQESIPQDVNQLLDDLIDKSIELVGKPVAQMKKEDKIKAIDFLNERGAFLVTKSADRVAQHFGISKYTIYNYTNVNKNQE